MQIPIVHGRIFLPFDFIVNRAELRITNRKGERALERLIGYANVVSAIGRIACNRYPKRVFACGHRLVDVVCKFRTAKLPSDLLISLNNITRIKSKRNQTVSRAVFKRRRFCRAHPAERPAADTAVLRCTVFGVKQAVVYVYNVPRLGYNRLIAVLQYFYNHIATRFKRCRADVLIVSFCGFGKRYSCRCRILTDIRFRTTLVNHGSAVNISVKNLRNSAIIKNYCQRSISVSNY